MGQTLNTAGHAKPSKNAAMKSLLIAGWRGLSHSIAMVNQHQILALARRGDIALSHIDMPWAMAHWNKLDHSAGFSPSDQALIDRLPPADEGSVDCVYRICSPMYPPNPAARRTLTFGITELGYDRDSLHNPEQNLAEITVGDNLVITASRWSRDRLLDFGFPEEKVRVVLHGVDPNTFTPLSLEEKQQQRQSLGLSDDTVVFLNVGVPTWNKGIDLLVRAFASVHRHHPNTRLILKDARGLYGLPVDTVLQTVSQNYPGLITPEVLAAIMVIPNNLTQRELRHLYGFVDYYVSPYRAEGFNLPVLEAQACGTPVIISSGGATDDFCYGEGVRKIASVFKRGSLGKHKECCWVEPDYPALETLLTQAAAAGPRTATDQDSIRQAARHNAERYSWDNVVADLTALL